MSILANHLTYHHINRELLFYDISFSVDKGEKIALIGNNGCGKSTLLKIIAKEKQATSGEIICNENLYYIPQHYGQYNHLTIAEVLGIEKKLAALRSILNGEATEENFSNLEDDWEIEEKVNKAFTIWKINHLQPDDKISILSGGEKTKVFLSGIQIYEPDIILMDEPSNHLDTTSREKLYEVINTIKATLLIVSHDRQLLNLLPSIYELTPKGVIKYGGNYSFYREEKTKKITSLEDKLEEKQKELRATRKAARKVMERQEKQNARGEKQMISKGVSRIAMGGYKDKAERSTSRLKDIGTEKEVSIQKNITEIRDAIPDLSQMKVNFEYSGLHLGKLLIEAKQLNYKYEKQNLWSEPVKLTIRSGDRIAIEGDNGSGKTTLLKLITGQLDSQQGSIKRTDHLKYVFIDQNYSIINKELTVLEQINSYNERLLLDSEIKTILNRYLFPRNTWDKSCSILSGGEQMRLTLCCLMVSENTPDLFILDEPTNNLDISSIEILTATIKDFKGSIIVISHDQLFKEEIKTDYTITLKSSI